MSRCNRVLSPLYVDQELSQRVRRACILPAGHPGKCSSLVSVARSYSRDERQADDQRQAERDAEQRLREWES